MSTIQEQFDEYQRLMLDHPRAKVFDTSPPGILFERIHIDRPIVFGACLRKTSKLPVFEFLIPEASLQ